MALLFLKDTDATNNKNIHMFTDCQSALITAFITEMQWMRLKIKAALYKFIGFLVIYSVKEV